MMISKELGWKKYIGKKGPTKGESILLALQKL
jgi:hypothetical protein